MGILNVTPDSFSDGGRHQVPDAALRQAEAMLTDGAALIDIGGESTRPGASPVSLQEEQDRVLPVLERLVADLGAAVSVDTSAPEVMREAARLGAVMINDVRSLRRPGALEAAAESRLDICLMHMVGEPDTMQQQPHYDVPIERAVIDFLQARLEACREAGIDDERLVIDPGFGFAKTLAHNLRLMNRLECLQELKRPMLVGTSRKGMIGRVVERDVSERIPGGLALTTLAIRAGARIIRTHDVAPTVDVVRMTRAVVQEGREQ
ncbi:dihydropteroate synthase [Kushneria phosphatilytica]|uniref:dihydropteroate synthase n=2 Tax=Kushneria phosphatilytica TaxID=657387 RepID=A0A1S1NWA5_9GAMM|nr:dihydropteroate synthase [Kushneria phosphatilytica]QEL12892.1 dihydropteroate synthase [Kushneria phosphatilytica]